MHFTNFTDDDFEEEGLIVDEDKIEMGLVIIYIELVGENEGK